MQLQIVNHTEADERQYLEIIKTKLQETIDNADNTVTNLAREVKENKEFLWENKAGMDHAEKVAVRQSITQIAMTGESALEKKKRLVKLLQSPYFGRIDFSENSRKGASTPLYIGIHSFFDQEHSVNLVHDWRAPVSGMFYDFELGEAYFEAPSGLVEGIIALKRQYRIRNGKMEFMLESALNIHDDILQKELSQNSSDRMKTIVATIQRDQNAIIRNEDSRALIIQGVAGSGKTSIALHRIAFLLYRFKNTIKSEDILIISPNKVFADYISNVLPELGEEKIEETSMEELAHGLLDNKFKFQTFFEQVSHLLDKDDPDMQERIRFKSGFECLNKLSEFATCFENEYFKPADLLVKRYPVPASYILEKFKGYHRLPVLKRIPEIVRDIVSDMAYYNRHEVNAAERNQIRKEIEKMFLTTNLRLLYKEFYQWLGKPQMLKMSKGNTYEYADVFPLVFLKMSLEGIKPYDRVRHLVVDEMQDYTPMQYHVLARLFPCNKTILGDSNQMVNPFGSSDAEIIAKVFPYADQVSMNKSYRSTFEIARFAQRIRHNPHLEAVERHGNEPEIRYFKTEAAELEEIHKLIAEFMESPHQSLGIICKKQSHARKIYESLGNQFGYVYLIDEHSASFSNGVIISTAHMAKGLEFDHVIVPFASATRYKTETDRQMLYVACTRAMHQLDITFTGKLTGLIN